MASMRRLGESHAGQGIEAVSASQLRRCQQTSAAIAGASGGLGVTSRADLREVDLGQADFDIRLLPAEEQAEVAERIISEGTWDAFPGSEGHVAARARVGGVMDEIVAANGGKRLIVVVHAGFIQTYVSLRLGP